MTNTLKSATILAASMAVLFTSLALCGCDTATVDGDTGSERDTMAGLPDTAGAMWEPCRFESGPPGPELDGWGCDEGLACQKPLHADAVLSICAPFSELGCPDAEYDGEPFGDGFVSDKAYCQPACGDDLDCLDGMRCGSFGMCAWEH
jgi:hypothetical protein